MSSSSFTIIVFLLWTHYSIFISFLYCGAQNFTQYSRWGSTNDEYSETITSFSWLAILCLMHLRICLVLLDTRAHCWLILSLQSTKTPISLSAGLHPSLLSSSLAVHSILHHLICRIWHLFLLNSICLVMALNSHLSKSLCKDSLPLRDWTASLNLVSLANLLSVHSNLVSRHW